MKSRFRVSNKSPFLRRSLNGRSSSNPQPLVVLLHKEDFDLQIDGLPPGFISCASDRFAGSSKVPTPFMRFLELVMSIGEMFSRNGQPNETPGEKQIMDFEIPIGGNDLSKICLHLEQQQTPEPVSAKEKSERREVDLAEKREPIPNGLAWFQVGSAFMLACLWGQSTTHCRNRRLNDAKKWELRINKRQEG